MRGTLYYVFILILVMIAVAYYKGTSSILSNVGSTFSNLVLILQGRDPKSGSFEGYPKVN